MNTIYKMGLIRRLKRLNEELSLAVQNGRMVLVRALYTRRNYVRDQLQLITSSGK